MDGGQTTAHLNFGSGELKNNKMVNVDNEH